MPSWCDGQFTSAADCDISVTLSMIGLVISGILVIYTIDRFFFYPKRNLIKITKVRNKIGTYNSNSERIKTITPMINGTEQKFEQIELPLQTPECDHDHDAESKTADSKLAIPNNNETTNRTPSTFSSALAMNKSQPVVESKTPNCGDNGNTDNSNNNNSNNNNDNSHNSNNKNNNNNNNVNSGGGDATLAIPTIGSNKFVITMTSSGGIGGGNGSDSNYSTPIVRPSLTPTVSHKKLIGKMGELQRECELINKTSLKNKMSVISTMICSLLTLFLLIFLNENDIACQHKQYYLLFYCLQRICLYYSYVQRFVSFFHFFFFLSVCFMKTQVEI